MPRNPRWMSTVLRNHPLRTIRPLSSILRRGSIPTKVVRHDHRVFLELVRGRFPSEYERLSALKVREEGIFRSIPHSEFAYLEAFSKSRSDPVTFDRGIASKRRQLELAARAVDRYTQSLLRRHPDLRAKFKTKMLRKYADLAGTQITWKGRHTETDKHLFSLVQRLGMSPTSFLEVGAAFDSRMEIEPYLPDGIAPVKETRELFENEGIRMKYVAADLAPIGKKEQLEYLKGGITAISWDYRKRPLALGGKIRQFSIIRMANVSRHQTRSEFVETVNVLLKSLEPNGILIIKNTQEFQDEVFYQKKQVKGNWKLVPVPMTQRKPGDRRIDRRSFIP